MLLVSSKVLGNLGPKTDGYPSRKGVHHIFMMHPFSRGIPIGFLAQITLNFRWDQKITVTKINHGLPGISPYYLWAKQSLVQSTTHFHKSSICREICLRPLNWFLILMPGASKIPKKYVFENVQKFPKAHPHLACDETVWN